MKKDIHPQYHANCTVTCVCGNTFETGSVKEEIRVEICAACHPFFTGQEKLVDTEGRVERFEKRMSAKKVSKKAKDKTSTKNKQDDQPKSLKDMLNTASESTEEESPSKDQAENNA